MKTFWKIVSRIFLKSMAKILIVLFFIASIYAFIWFLSHNDPQAHLPQQNCRVPIDICRIL